MPCPYVLRRTCIAWVALNLCYPLFPVAAFVLLAAVARTLGVAADLALVRLHRPLLVAESAGAGRRMIAIPVGPSGYRFPIANI